MEYFAETPTFAEAGYPGTQASFYLGLAAPAGTAAALVERYNAAAAGVRASNVSG